MFRSPVKRDVIHERLCEAFADDMREYLRDARVCVADIAERVGINAHTLQGYVTGTACPPTDKLIRIHRVVPLLRTLNVLGELCAERDEHNATIQEIMHGLAAMGEASAHASAAVIKALADNHLDSAEREACRKRVADHVAEGQRMLAMLEAPSKKQATKRPTSLKDAEAMSKGKGRAA